MAITTGHVQPDGKTDKGQAPVQRTEQTNHIPKTLFEQSLECHDQRDRVRNHEDATRMETPRTISLKL